MCDSQQQAICYILDRLGNSVDIAPRRAEGAVIAHCANRALGAGGGGGYFVLPTVRWHPMGLIHRVPAVACNL
jgi:hypothetical protein